MNPRTKISSPHLSVLGYCSASPNGADYSSSQQTAHYSLLTAHSSSASGWQLFKYGKLGEVTENIRTFALPYDNQSYTFKMKYRYDSYNRIRTMTYPDGEVVSYGYNLGGLLESVTGDKNGVAYRYINGSWQYFYVLENPTLYASPYVVATPKGYTKHYYAESERIASRIGGGGLRDIKTPVRQVAVARKVAVNSEMLDKVFLNCLGVRQYSVGADLRTLYDWIDSLRPEDDCYWYHPDHLGSSSWITYSDGSAIQHLHYLPWGEDLVNQRSTTWNAMYTFSAKEKDAETGYSYFGARYYSSDLSIWLSVDPMSDKYPSTSPYAYCRNNPIKVIDPDGEDEWELNRWGKVVNHIQTDKHDAFYIVDRNGNRIEGKNVSFDYKTVEQFKSQYCDQSKKRYDWYNVRGDNNASTLFKFLADNTNVEWSHLFLGESGDKGLNIISTSHEKDRERSATFLLEQKYKYGYTIRGCNHNHPNNTPFPSGLSTGGEDIGFAKYLTKIANDNGCGTPFFKIYTPKNGKYINYTQTSTIYDFPVSFSNVIIR